MSVESPELGLRADLGRDERELEVLLLDREQIDAEFAAIMIASGFGDRIVAATAPRPLDTARRPVVTPRRALRGADRRRTSSRVRSPPTRPIS